MSEEKAIEKSVKPVTIESLVKELQDGGVKAGSTVIVHSSLSSLGWVCGGPVTLIKALMKVITDGGTLVMPGHSGDYSDPVNWENPPVPDDWCETIRDEMPPYQPEITPTRGVGVVPEVFRKFPGVLRSDHPCLSFIAWGKNAQKIVSDHQLEYAMGEASPLADIYRMGGDILLIGVGHDSNTSLHLAEYMADYQKKVDTYGSPIKQDGERLWVEYEDIKYDSDDFKKVGKAYEKQGEFEVFDVGYAQAKLIPQKSIVDFAVTWFENNR